MKRINTRKGKPAAKPKMGGGASTNKMAMCKGVK